MTRFIAALTFALLTVACSDDTLQLVLEVKTDLLPNQEFTSLRLEVGSEVRDVVVPIRSSFLEAAGDLRCGVG